MEDQEHLYVPLNGERKSNKSIQKSAYSGKLSGISVIQDFDPFKNPPDFQQATQHAKSIRIGKISSNKNLRVCPCCQNIISNEQFPLTIDSGQLIQLGIGYSLFYDIYKLFILIVAIVLVVSGGAFYLLITKDCVENCYFFLGFTIINLEISAQETVKKTTTMYALTSFILFFVCVIVKKIINKRIYQLEQTTINPSQYSILLQNIPSNTSAQDIKSWSKKVFGQQPIEVLILHDSAELTDSIAMKIKLLIQYNQEQIKQAQLKQRTSVHPDDTFARYSRQQNASQKKNTLKQIQQQTKIIQKYNLDQDSSSSHYPWTGSCILTFNNSSTVDNVLLLHEHSTLNYFYRSLKNLFSADPLLLEKQKVVVCKAPEPREILWGNMEFSFKKDLIMGILLVLVMVGLMALAFKVQFAFVDYAYTKWQQQIDSWVLLFEAFIMTIIIVCLNYILRLVTKLLADITKPHSYTIQESRFCSSYTFLFILNSCLTIYIVHGAAIKGNNQLLLYDIHLVILITSLSGPLYKILNPRMWLRSLWRYHVMRLEEDKNPYIQIYVNRLFEGEESANADNYQYIYRTLFIAVWFANIAPLGVFFALIFMIIDYWIAKFMLLRANKQSKILSLQITKPVLFLQLLPLVYIAGILPFILKISTNLPLDHFINQFYTYGVVFLILLIIILAYLIIGPKKKQFIPPMPYQKLQLGFLHNYESQNPLTRLSGQIKYLEKILKSGKLRSNEIEIVQQAIQVKKQTIDPTAHKIIGLNRIKHKIQRRIIDQVNKQLQDNFGKNLKIMNNDKKVQQSAQAVQLPNMQEMDEIKEAH